MDATLNSLQSAIVRFRDERDWKQFHSTKDLAIALSVEAAELLDLTKWKSEEALRSELPIRREALGEELSDCLYYVLLMAHDLEIDLALAFRTKMEKNAKHYPIHSSRGNSRKYTEL